jgi:hypothetical protein
MPSLTGPDAAAATERLPSSMATRVGAWRTPYCQARNEGRRRGREQQGTVTAFGEGDA